MQVARLLLLVASCCWEGWRGKLVSGGALSLHHQVFSDHFKNVDSNWSYACAPDIVNVFEGGLMLPGCLELSLAATVLCQLQLWALWRSSRREFVVTVAMPVLQSFRHDGDCEWWIVHVLKGVSRACQGITPKFEGRDCLKWQRFSFRFCDKC